VSVYDVSVRRGEFIAVAAIYNVSGRAPAASLLYYYFDFGGRLLMASALDSSRQVMWLTVDDDSNVWALITRPGGRNPPEAPLVAPADWTQEALITSSSTSADKKSNVVIHGSPSSLAETKSMIGQMIPPDNTIEDSGKRSGIRTSIWPMRATSREQTVRCRAGTSKCMRCPDQFQGSQRRGGGKAGCGLDWTDQVSWSL